MVRLAPSYEVVTTMMRRLALIFSLAVFCVLMSVSSAVAAEGLTVDPAVVRLTMKPGEMWRGTVTVINEKNHAVTLRFTPANLSRETNSDTLELTEDITARLGTLASWAHTAIDSLTLPAGQRSVLDFVIQVPNNAPPGSHRGIIAMVPTPTGPQSNALSVTAAVALGIDLTVVGQPNHHLALRDMVVGPRIGMKPPVSVLATLANTGNTLPRVSVQARVGRPWGDTVLVTLTSENGTNVIAPGSQSLWKGAWEGDGFFPIGLFKARIIAEDSSGTYEATRYFILVPWPVLVGLLLAGALLLYVRFRHRR